MAIQMIGIDHSVAAIDIRTVFSFTQKKTVEALEIIKQEKGICGCVLLSTCNRMELWVSTEEGCVITLYELLCKIRAIHNDEYQKYFTERKEEDAVQHLFRLACGLESRILGEDQTHAFSIVNTPASLRDLHDTAAVLTHGNGHIRTFLLQNGCGKFSHLPVSDDHTFFAFYFQTFLSKCLKCPVDHRMIAFGKRHICPHFLAGSHRHAK